MKKFLSSILLCLLVCLGAKAASPTFAQFFGTNGIILRTNGNVVQVDGIMLTNGASAVYITTNLIVYENTYTSNLYATNIFVDQFIQVSNVFATNITVENISISTNLTVQNIITTNITVNQSIVVSNVYVTNLYANSIIGPDILWTNDNGTVRLINETKVGIGTNAGDALWLLERNTNAINGLSFSTGGVMMAMIDSNGNWYAQGLTSGGNGITMLTTNSATTFAYNLDLRKRGTTGNAAAAVTQGTELGNVLWKGWDGAAYGIGAAIVVKSDEIFTPADYGAHIEFRVVPTNTVSATEAIRIQAINATNPIITFIGQSALFPAIKRWGRELQIRSADDTGFADLVASNASFAGPLLVTGNLGRIRNVAYTWPSANATGAFTNDGSGNVGWDANISGGGGGIANVRTNQFTTNVSGSPVIGALWLQGTDGGGLTNGARTTYEYSPSNSSVRIGTVFGNGQAGAVSPSTSTYSNYWDPTNVGIFSWVFGSNSINRGQYSSITGGEKNVIETNAHRSFIGGGSQNVIATSAAESVIAGGTNNTISAANIGNFIGGGGDNHIRNPSTTSYGFIGGGFGNIIGPNAAASAQYSFIGAGLNNNNFGAYCFLGGGNANSMSSFSTTIPQFCFIGGGNANKMPAASGSASTSSSIVGGEANAVGDTSAGGVSYGFIGGGLANFVGAGSTYSAIVSGEGNTVSGLHSYVLGGKSNLLENSYAFSIGAVSNDVTSTHSGVIGSFGTNSTTKSILVSPAGTHGSNRLHITATATTNIGPLHVKIGASSFYAAVGGTITNASGTIYNAGATITNLITCNIKGNTLTNNGDRLSFRASGKLAANANAKQVTVYFGSDIVFDSGSQAVNAGSWVVTGEIIRTGDTAQIVNGAWAGTGTTLFNLATSRDTAQTNGIDTLLRVTSTATADADITNRTLTVEYHPVNTF